MNECELSMIDENPVAHGIVRRTSTGGWQPKRRIVLHEDLKF